MSDFDWEKDTWEVIQNYFRSNPYFSTRHQLDSYNMFLRDRLPKTLRQFNPIPLTYTVGSPCISSNMSPSVEPLWINVGLDVKLYSLWNILQ